MIVTPPNVMIHPFAVCLDCTNEQQKCSVSVKDTTELRLVRKTDSSASTCLPLP